jgi:hypothetical protein
MRDIAPACAECWYESLSLTFGPWPATPQEQGDSEEDHRERVQCEYGCHTEACDH